MNDFVSTPVEVLVFGVSIAEVRSRFALSLLAETLSAAAPSWTAEVRSRAPSLLFAETFRAAAQSWIADTRCNAASPCLAETNKVPASPDFAETEPLSIMAETLNRFAESDLAETFNAAAPS